MTRAVPFSESLYTIVFSFESGDFAGQIIEDEGNLLIGAGMDACSAYYQDYYESQFGRKRRQFNAADEQHDFHESILTALACRLYL